MLQVCFNVYSSHSAASEKPSEKPQGPEEEEGRGGGVTSPTSDDELKTHADRVKEQGDQLEEVKAQVWRSEWDLTHYVTCMPRPTLHY